MKKFLITILIVLFGIPYAFAQWGGQDPFPPKKQSHPGELALDTVTTLIRKSNPDGIIGHPSFTLWAGFGGGGIKYSVGSSNVSNGDASSYILRADLTYPASQSISLLLQMNFSGQTQSFPETSEYFREETSLNGFGIVVGIRIFSAW
jgi:hypothetical protein